MHLNLQPIFESFKPFEISLNGFGSFDKKNNKVIYLHAEENNLLSEMHRKLMLLLRAEFNFSETETAFEFHPHITIASRDLSSENFHKAWLEYKDKPFRAKFYVNRAYLMKHNFKKWEVLSEFQFRRDR